MNIRCIFGHVWKRDERYNICQRCGKREYIPRKGYYNSTYIHPKTGSEFKYIVMVEEAGRFGGLVRVYITDFDPKDEVGYSVCFPKILKEENICWIED